MTAATEDLSAKIVNQLEYYFGNINLPRDKFLQDKIKEDEGWVTIETLLTFNRLANLSKDIEAIATAVKNGKSEIISVSEDGTKIRRNIGNPLPENSLEYWQQIKHCTVYMKGFSQETTLDDIQNWAKQFGALENVLMRRTKPDRIFKGSVFVTYKTREEAEKAQKDTGDFGETKLVKMMQDDYWALKNRETKEKRAAEKAVKSGKNYCANEEKKHAKDQAVFVKGLILEVEGLPKAAPVAELKDFFGKFGKVGYIVNEGIEGDKAQVRFSDEENGAKTAWEKAVAAAEDGKVMFGENEITASVLEGDAEAAYWTAFNESKKNKFDRRQNKRGGGRGGRGGRGRGGGRGGFHGHKRAANGDSEAPQSKRTVFADED